MFASNTSQVSEDANYIESCFSTYLYTGNGSTQTITNGIDLSTKGGLVWIKGRTNTFNHFLRSNGIGDNYLSSNTTASATDASGFSYSTSTTGFSFSTGSNLLNGTSNNYASWTFRKQPKFFDVVTFSGNSASGRQIAHSLGSAPGCIIVKNLTNADEWLVWHRSLNDFAGSGNNLVLNTTAAQDTGGYFGVASTQTSTYFTVNANVTKINWSGNNYVAYLFAHNAGGFGLTGTDNVISCGSYTTNASGNATITLGYEPQWILMKNINTVSDWVLYDNMRGLTAPAGTSNRLFPNLSSAAADTTSGLSATSTGFFVNAGGASGYSETSIYIAIRRGPMKVPTSGTSVFSVDYQGQYTPKPPGHTSGFVTDMALVRNKNTTNDMINVSRLTGDNYLITSSTAAAGSLSFIDFDYMNGWGDLSTTDANYYSWMWKRAPNTHDEVCYTGTGSARTQAHNLGVVPELMIVKSRTNATNWQVYSDFTASSYSRLFLNTTASATTGIGYNAGTNFTAQPTATSLFLDFAYPNSTGETYVAYLFATCAGVSKCGTFTGNGSSQAINCGFTSGARFVMIKATSTTGNWICVDSARGMTTSSNPVLYLNSTAAETATSGACITSTGGFTVDESKLTGVNTSGVSYIFLSYA